MQTQNTKMGIDFTGQNIYVGIDTHYKTWMVSIYGFYLLNIEVKRKYRETPAIKGGKPTFDLRHLKDSE